MDDSTDRAQAARDHSPYLTAKQTAYHLGIGYSTLRKLRAAGRAPIGRLHGRTWRYHIDDIDAWSAARASGDRHD
ncbi:helix-turn-helix transcriptional regulator [Sphingomonas sp. UYP23]